MKKIILGIFVVAIIILLIRVSMFNSYSIVNPVVVSASVEITNDHSYHIYGELVTSAVCYHSYKTRTEGDVLYISLYGTIFKMGRPLSGSFDIVVKDDGTEYTRVILDGGKDFEKVAIASSQNTIKNEVINYEGTSRNWVVTYKIEGDEKSKINPK